VTSTALETTTAVPTGDVEEPVGSAPLAIARGCDPRVRSNRHEIIIRCRQHIVRGSTLAQLSRELDGGVLDPNDKNRFPAYTSWYVNWRYRFTTSSRGCAILDPTISVRFAFRVPRWNAKGEKDQAVVEEWNRFYGALWRHERGHVRNGLRAANQIERTLKKLPTSPTCDHLEAKADRAGAHVIKRHRMMDLVYDVATAHGATQGALLAP
jgi:predicted secreted Zn-dependent protease